MKVQKMVEQITQAPSEPLSTLSLNVRSALLAEAFAWLEIQERRGMGCPVCPSPGNQAAFPGGIRVTSSRAHPEVLRRTPRVYVLPQMAAFPSRARRPVLFPHHTHWRLFQIRPASAASCDVPVEADLLISAESVFGSLL